MRPKNLLGKTLVHNYKETGKKRKTGNIRIITVAGNLTRDKTVSHANKTITRVECKALSS